MTATLASIQANRDQRIKVIVNMYLDMAINIEIVEAMFNFTMEVEKCGHRCVL